MRNLKEAIIITNNSCNLKCIYCKVDELSRNTISKEHIKNLIDELSLRKISFLHYIGGEPLLRKDIFEIMNYSKEKEIKNVLHSNGSSLKLFHKALPHIHTYHTCLNGNKKSHEITRGINTFDHVMNCIKLAKEQDVNVIVDMILTFETATIENIDFVIEQAIKNSFKINFQKVFAHNLVGVNANDIVTIQASNEKLFNLFTYIEKQYDKNIFHNSLDYIKTHQEKNQIEVNECKNDIIVINYSGNVSTCYGFMNNENNGLKIGWHTAINNILQNNTGCTTCSYSNHAESNLKNNRN